MTAQEEEAYRRLLVRAQAGDADAYERCLTGLSRLLRAYVRHRVGDVAWVDDVVQECLLSLHAARHTYSPERSFAAWFYAIARNRLIDGIRRATRRRAREIALEGQAEPVTAMVAERHPVQDALVHLPDRQREVITALKVDGDSVREVAGRLGMSESAVKVTAHRGYQALRRLLRREGVRREGDND